MFKKRLAGSALVLSLALMVPHVSMAMMGGELNLNKKRNKKIIEKKESKNGIGSLLARSAVCAGLIGTGFMGAYYLERHVPKDPSTRNFFRNVVKPVSRTFAKWVIPVSSFVGLFGERIARFCGKLVGTGIDSAIEKSEPRITHMVKHCFISAGVGGLRGATGDVFTKLKNAIFGKKKASEKTSEEQQQIEEALNNPSLHKKGLIERICTWVVGRSDGNGQDQEARERAGKVLEEIGLKPMEWSVIEG